MTESADLLSKPGFCMLPWVSLQISPDGTVAACYKTNSYHRLGNLHEDGLESIWRGGELSSMRRKMRGGEVLPQCRDCSEEEALGRKSLRMESNLVRYAGDSARASEADVPPPVFLDVTFSNKCNFRCRICGPHYSTGWYADARRLGQDVPAGPVRPVAPGQSLAASILPRLAAVRRFTFAGGEPLLDDDHLALLSALHERGQFGTELNYNTNFSILEHRGTYFPSLWKDFDRVVLSLSLDGNGARGEYMRKGQRWDEVAERFARLKTDVPRAEIRIYCTVSAYNGLHLPEFAESLLEARWIEPKDFFVNFLRHPEHLSLQIYPEAMKRELQDRYVLFQKKLMARFGIEAAFPLIRASREVLGFARSADRSRLVPEFAAWNEKVDAIRGEDLWDVFPELKGLRP